MKGSEVAVVEDNVPDNIKKEPPDSPRPFDGNDLHGFGEVAPENQTKVEPPDHVNDNFCGTGSELYRHIKSEPGDEMEADPSYFTGTIPNDRVEFKPSYEDNTETFHYDDLGTCTEQKTETEVHAGSFQRISGDKCDYFKVESEDYVPEEMETYVKIELKVSDFVGDGVVFRTESDLNIKYEVETSGSSAFTETFSEPSLSSQATATATNDALYVKQEQQHEITDSNGSESSGDAADMRQVGVFVIPLPGQLPIHVIDPLHGGGVQMVPGTVVLVSFWTSALDIPLMFQLIQPQT
jgi:hypothetical protein